MALDNVPFILNTPGVEHKSETVRAFVWAATGGASGVIGSGSLKVVANSTPNGTVQVRPGNAVVESNFPGHVGQSYTLRNITNTSVTIPATTSAGGRTDAVIVRVDDAGITGQTPANLQTYDYVKLQLVQGVSSSIKTAKDLNLPYPAVLLAKITLPASTGTVTNAHITDMREVVLGREKTVTLTHAQVIADGAHDLNSQLAYPRGEYFPDYGAGTGTMAVDWVTVPEWATSMTIRAEWLSVALQSKSGNGQMWVTYDEQVRNDPAHTTQYFKWTSEDTWQRQNWIVMDTRNVPASYRGKDIAFGLRARRDTGNSSGRVWMDASSGTTLTITFKELAD